MAEFKVGGKVVCVKDHSEKLVKTGIVYPVNYIHKCSCGALSLDVGIEYDLNPDFEYGVTQCHCGKIDESPRPLFDSCLFLPLDDFQQVTYTKILEQVPVGAQ